MRPFVVTSVFQYPRLDAGRVAPLPALNRVAVASILALSIFSPSVAVLGANGVGFEAVLSPAFALRIIREGITKRLQEYKKHDVSHI